MALADGADDRDADALACGLPTNVFVRPAGSREPADVVDEVLDVLQRAEWRNDPDLFFQVGQGRHSAGGRPVLHGAVCDCLEKDMRSSLRAREGLDHVHVWHRAGRDRYASSPRAAG